MIRAIYKLWLANYHAPLFQPSKLARGQVSRVSLWRQIANAVEHEAHERIFIVRKQQITEDNYELFDL